MSSKMASGSGIGLRSLDLLLPTQWFWFGARTAWKILGMLDRSWLFLTSELELCHVPSYHAERIRGNQNYPVLLWYTTILHHEMLPSTLKSPWRGNGLSANFRVRDVDVHIWQNARTMIWARGQDTVIIRKDITLPGDFCVSYGIPLGLCWNLSAHFQCLVPDRRLMMDVRFLQTAKSSLRTSEIKHLWLQTKYKSTTEYVTMYGVEVKTQPIHLPNANKRKAKKISRFLMHISTIFYRTQRAYPLIFYKLLFNKACHDWKATTKGKRSRNTFFHQDTVYALKRDSRGKWGFERFIFYALPN